MIQKLFILLLTVFFIDCVGVVSKSFDKYDPESKGNRVRKTVHGPAVVFSAFPIGDSMDTKEAVEELRKVNNCKDLKNIDVEFFHQSLILVSFQKMVIHADCEKGKANAVPSVEKENVKLPAKETIEKEETPEKEKETPAEDSGN